MAPRFSTPALSGLFSLAFATLPPQVALANDSSVSGLAAYICNSAFDDSGRFAYSVEGRGEATASTKAAAEAEATDVALDDCVSSVAVAQDSSDLQAAHKCRERGRDHGMGTSDFWCELHPTHGWVMVNGCAPSFDFTLSDNAYCKRISIECTLERTLTASDVFGLYDVDLASSSPVYSYRDRWTCKALATGGVYHSVNCGVELTLSRQNEPCLTTSLGTTSTATEVAGLGL